MAITPGLALSAGEEIEERETECSIRVRYRFQTRSCSHDGTALPVFFSTTTAYCPALAALSSTSSTG